MCVHVLSMCVPIFICVCVQTCVLRLKVDIGYLSDPLNHSLPYFLRWGLSLSLELSISLDQLTREPHNSPGSISQGLRFPMTPRPTSKSELRIHAQFSRLVAHPAF